MYYYNVRSIYSKNTWSFVPKIKKLTNNEIIEVKAKNLKSLEYDLKLYITIIL
jgi:hypothetical protein